MDGAENIVGGKPMDDVRKHMNDLKSKGKYEEHICDTKFTDYNDRSLIVYSLNNVRLMMWALDTKFKNKHFNTTEPRRRLDSK